MESRIKLASEALGMRAPGIMCSAAHHAKLPTMESCINLASEALGVRVLGIVHSAAQ